MSHICRGFSQYATHPEIGPAVVKSCSGDCQREKCYSASSQRWGTPESNKSNVEAKGVKVKRKDSHWH